MTPMSESTLGMSIAAAAPCTRRAATRAPGLAASPQAAELSVNSARPSENMRRRPSWSPSRLAGIKKIAEVRP
jgi:hypothetical protein